LPIFGKSDPKDASITWDMYYEWKDTEWMKKRKKHNSLDAPWSVYEVHLGQLDASDKNDEESYNTYDR
jgi:1,4-alpha-glucan branching enzyme